MNRAKLVVVIALGIIVLGLAGMLYYYNLRPILAERGNPAWQAILLPAGADSGEIAIDPKGRVWISGSRERYTDQDGYLAVWDGTTWQEFTNDQVGLIPKVGDFGFDSTGRVWIAVPTGAAAFNGKTWTAYAMQTGEDCVWSTLAIDRGDRVWLGGEGCDLTVFDGNEWIKLHKDQSFSPHVSALAVDPLGRVWVGTSQNKGLFIYDGTGWTEYPISEIPHLMNMQDSKKGIGQGVWIRDIALDSTGRAWIATNEGLVSVNPVTIGKGRPDWRVEIQEGPILNIEFDAAGYVYAKSFVREGIMVRDGDLWKDLEKVQINFGPVDDLPDVQSLASHPDGRIWISTHDYSGGRQRLFILNYDQLALSGSRASEDGASDRLPILALPTLVLLVLLLLAALLTRLAGSDLSSKQITSDRWIRGWVLANGLAWLTAASIFLLPQQWIFSEPLWRDWARPFMLWMPVVGVIMSAIWAAGQWIGLAAVLPQSGRLAAKTFIGALSGFACFYAGGIILLIISEAGLEESAEFGYFLICCFPLALGVLYFSSLWLAGSATGLMQKQILEEIPMPIEKWARRNAKIMALSGFLGPLGGIVYGLSSGEILRPNLFGKEKI